MHTRAHVTRAAILVALIAIVAVAPAVAVAAPYTRLQVLMPGESAAPGTSSGRTGTARAQVSGIPFNVTVRACDASWNLVPTTTNVIQLLSSDASATLPAPGQLTGGSATLTVTFHAGGTFTIFAHDQTDGTIPDGASSTVSSQVLQTFDFSSIRRDHQNAGAPFRVTINAETQSGSTVTGFNGRVVLREFTSFGEGRTNPETMTFTNGVWTGDITCYRSDETNRSRGNVYLQAELESNPSTFGTSTPFIVETGSTSRIQLVVPGQQPLPGSVSGLTGTPAAQLAGRAFNVTAYSTDSWWNRTSSSDVVRVTSSDGAANTPQSNSLSSGSRTFSIILNSVGSRTLTVSDISNPSRTGMTTAGIQVVPNGAHHFAISSIATPQVAGVPVSVTIRAVDVGGNPIAGYDGDARLSANTGAGSITPEDITFVNGVWSGSMTFKGAGGVVSFVCADYNVPPLIGTSNAFSVSPGPIAGFQVLLPGETPEGGTADGQSGTPTPQSAGQPFTLTIRAVDAYWNLVTGVSDRFALGSSDAFAAIPAETTLTNGQRQLSARLFRTGAQRFWASGVTRPSLHSDTSSAVMVSGGPFSRLVVLAPGEFSAPGTGTGRAGTATDQSINYAFTVTVLATDNWFNPINGVSDVIRITSDDPLATLPPNTAMVNGRADMQVRLARGGYNQITAADVTTPARTGSSTQVRAISSGFHLEAVITQATAGAGEPFTLSVKVTNDAGSVIQEINSFVTLEVQNASTGQAGHGTLLTSQFQLLQGQRSISQTYTSAEPIVIVAHDDQGNAPATSNPITITPGDPVTIALTSDPPWVTGNKHSTVTARLVDAYDNGIPANPMAFAVVTGGGTLTPIDNVTNTDGRATADFLSPRQPEKGRIRATSGAISTELEIETALVDPNAVGGAVTNYPNPFHPPDQPTTIAYKLDDDAAVTLRIFTQSGDLVLRKTFDRGAVGGVAGVNAFAWDGRNGEGAVVASGGYLLLIEAQGTGETLHVIRRKIAVVR